MHELTACMMLILVVVWPLLLVAGVAFATTRTVALRLVPWAALPALAAAGLLSDSGLRLPGVMLDSALVLDRTGQVFLLLIATLWLAGGWLARSQLHSAAPARFAVLLLLAMAGGFVLSLADDALLFFAAATLSGYALCGLMLCDADLATRQAGRVLVVLLVASDLVVFELLLILSQEAAGVDFSSLRQAFVNTDKQALLLGLLVVGFGIKLGVVGLHFWLAPVFVSAVPALRPALVGLMLGAGLLGWLRLTPLGEVQWIAAGVVLHWLAWMTLGWALIMGLLQTQVLSILAYAAVALSAFWVALLGSVLSYPQTWSVAAEAMMVTILQSGFALTAVLLLNRPATVGDPAWWRRLSLALNWLGVGLLAAVPVGVTATLRGVDDLSVWQMHGVTAVTAFLAVRGLLLAAALSRNAHDLSPSITVVQQSAQGSTTTTLLVAGGLTAAALLAAQFNLVGRPFAELWVDVLMLSVASLAARLSIGRVALRLPALPPGDLLVPISDGLSAVFARGQRLGDRQLPLWRDAGLARVRRLWSGADWWGTLSRIEFALNRWDTVLLVLLLLGLMLAWRGAVG